MTEQDQNDALGLQWNGKRLTLRGGVVIFFLAVLAIVASQLYAGWRTEQAVQNHFRQNREEHGSLRVSQDRTSCMVSLSQGERERFRQTYHAGAFKTWCPWVEE